MVCKKIFAPKHRIVRCLGFWLLQFCLCAFFYFTSLNLFAACNCPAPDPSVCPEQPMDPPYQPCTLYTTADSYVLRYSVSADHGAMTFIGNTLGLSKAECLNEPGTPGNVFDSIGAFTTTNPMQTVGSYATLSSGDGSPAGTTLDWTENGSSAVLNLPVGSTVLHAELIWSGSFGFYCGTPMSGSASGVDPNCVLDFADGPINFITPDGVTHLITADPATAFDSQIPSTDVQLFYCAGYYTRSRNVTPLLLALGDVNGTYTTGSVPATVSALDNTHNGAGWTLAIVYRDPAAAINNMTLFVGAQQGSRSMTPVEVSGFCAQTTSPSARLLVSAIEGDPNKTGDQMLFGPTPMDLTALSGPNNPENNFFCSQINDDNGMLITSTGTFCIFNAAPNTETLVPNGRQGYDITNVDCSSPIIPGQTTAYALGTVGSPSPPPDDYMINAIGVMINVDSPVIVPTKLVNGQLAINASLGDIVTFSSTLENTGTLDALDVIFQDTLESGLAFIPGSVTLNGMPVPGGDPEAGLSLGTVAMGDLNVITFDVQIVSPPPSGMIFVNRGTASFDFSACSEVISNSNLSNSVAINLTSSGFLPPTAFNGIARKCQFLNKTMYNLTATWVPPLSSGVVSYEIFEKEKLIATIPAEGPYIFETCLSSKKEGENITIIATYLNGAQSIPVQLSITYE